VVNRASFRFATPHTVVPRDLRCRWTISNNRRSVTSHGPHGVRRDRKSRPHRMSRLPGQRNAASADKACAASLSVLSRSRFDLRRPSAAVHPDRSRALREDQVSLTSRIRSEHDPAYGAGSHVRRIVDAVA
jgi:hypothetical protein